jgi:hypothetical protein
MTSETAYLLLALMVAGWLDRVRGGQSPFTWRTERRKGPLLAHVATSLACAIMAYLATNMWQAAVFGLFWGEVAWRQDNGWRGHWLRGDSGKRWWQPLRWGAIWAAPALLGAYWFPGLSLYMLAAPIGAWITIQCAVRLPHNKFYTDWSEHILGLRHAWAWSELLELPVIGLVWLALSQVVPLW